MAGDGWRRNLLQLFPVVFCRQTRNHQCNGEQALEARQDLFRSENEPVIKLTFAASGLASALLLFSSWAAFAQSEPWNTPYDPYFDRAELAPEYKVLPDGTEIRKVMLPGDVLLEMERKDGKIKIATFDQSGHGAVLCAKGIYQLVRAALDTCQDVENERVSRLVDEALDRMDHFILANSIEPVTMSQLQERDQTRLRKLRNDLIGPDASGQLKSCKADVPEHVQFPARLVSEFDKTSDEEFTARVDDLLSVPRLPAMNPCL
ncbi:hypothetical protein [Roseibium aggregatum]|uniref:hypothetical protein n=1 Tax=Roseibium aggregatum TaxID=187304 RepID=UPI0012F50AE0|nr:hypothetical protein [Roseibium aggregatum]